jgi:hypothetical protein
MAKKQVSFNEMMKVLLNRNFPKNEGGALGGFRRISDLEKRVAKLEKIVTPSKMTNAIARQVNSQLRLKKKSE